MKRYFAILSIALLLSLSASAQFFQNTVVKIRPFKALVLNPNVGFEKPFHRNFSVTAELTYKFACMYNNGNEWSLFSGCNGGEISVGARGYWGKVNKHLVEFDQKAPFGWYGEVQIAYKGMNIDSYHAGSFSATYSYVEDVAINDITSAYRIGYQFNAGNRITFDLNVGVNFHWLTSWRHDVISIDETNTEIIDDAGIRPGDVYRERDQRFGFVCQFALGYYIRFKKQQ